MKYLKKLNSFKITDLQGNLTINNVNVAFIPDITIDCKPPFIKGKLDSCWIKYKGSLDFSNKLECEKRVGMSLQSIGGS